MIGTSRDSRVTGKMISAPSTGCEFMIGRSSLVRRSAFCRTWSGTPILPTSWSRPPHSRASRSLSPRRITRPMSTEMSLTRHECSAVVRIPLVHSPGQRGDGLGEHLAHLDEVVIREPGRVEGEGEQEAGPPAALNICAMSHPRGASAIRLAAKSRGSLHSTVAAAGPCAAQGDPTRSGGSGGRGQRRLSVVPTSSLRGSSGPPPITTATKPAAAAGGTIPA